MKKSAKPKNTHQRNSPDSSGEGRDLTDVPETFCFCGCRVELWTYAHTPHGGMSHNQHLPVKKVSLDQTQFIFLVPFLSCWEFIDLPSSINEQSSLARGMELIIYALTVFGHYSCRMWVVRGCYAWGRGCCSAGMVGGLERGGDTTGTFSGAGRFLCRVWCSLENHCLHCNC